MDVSTVLIDLFQKAGKAFDLVWKLINYWTEKKGKQENKHQKNTLILLCKHKDFP